MAKRRKSTPEFKAELVLEVLSGATSQAEVCRRHNLNENQLSQMTTIVSPKREIVSGILSHRCIIRNAHIRR